MSDATIIEVELLSGRYHAHVWGESQFGMAGPEWPPSPWRLLRALASAWFCARPCPSLEPERDQLFEALGGSGSPELWLPRASLQELRFYQPVRLGASDRVLHHDHFAVPEGGRFWFQFPVSLGDDQRVLLGDLLARIRYFGRSESRALIRVAEYAEPPRGVHRVRARDGVASRSGVVYRRVLGTADDFRAPNLWSVDQAGGAAGGGGDHPPHLVDTLLGKKMPLPGGALWIEYAVPTSALVHEIRPRARAPVAVSEVQVAEVQFRLSRRIPIPLRQMVAVSRAFREAAVHAHRRSAPGQSSRTLTGREADGTIARGNDHAYYLPRFGNAGDMIDELVVRVPTGRLTRAELDALLGVERIRTGGRAYPITVVCERVLSAVAEPHPAAGARRWRSTTPFVPPLHRRRGCDATTPEEQAAACVERLCGRRPQVVRRVPGHSGLGTVTPLLAHEYVRGDVDQHGRRWKLTRRLGFWLEMTFTEAVTLDAPVGADAHFGAGRFEPVADPCAWGEVLDASELEALLSSSPGRIYRPSSGGNGDILARPQPVSLASVETRYEAKSRRFKTEGKGKTVKQLFSQPPRPRFRPVAYESSPSRRVYELRESSSEASFAAWPLARAAKLVVCLRDGAVGRLRQALPSRSGEIERVLVGRKPDGADEGPTSARVRIVPLPSIGHHHVDRAIRRVLVEVPAGCPLRAGDVDWAFSGLELVDAETGEVLDVILTPAVEEKMFARHYGVGEHASSRVWRTVTPAALPEAAARRRIEPMRRAAEAKDGRERASEQARAAAAANQALRHAEVRARVDVIRVQREPFENNGERVEAFAPGTRFAKERLWHVEVTFAAPLSGPLVIGDGRFLGLGVMAPIPRVEGLHAFVVEGGLPARPDPTEVARALRRAVMARVQEVLGDAPDLPTFFTGHERDGSPARSERRPHLAFVFDPRSARLLVVAPHVLDRRDPAPGEKNHLATLEEALENFRELRAGSAGRLMLRASSIDAGSDRLLAASGTWESVTPYQVTRHTKQVGAAEALATDLRAECRRRGLPQPLVTPLDARGVPGAGLIGRARLTFEVALEGPIALGRSRHVGGGLFAGTRGGPG